MKPRAARHSGIQGISPESRLPTLQRLLEIDAREERQLAAERASRQTRKNAGIQAKQPEPQPGEEYRDASRKRLLG